jgi:hypothetical protein
MEILFSLGVLALNLFVLLKCVRHCSQLSEGIEE